MNSKESKARFKLQDSKNMNKYGMDNSYYFTSDLHLSHESLMRGFRGTVFKSVKEHDDAITENLLTLPRGANLVIAGDLFWKFNSAQVKEFFDKFQKRKINIHIVYGNHDKQSWFSYKAVKSQGYMKVFSINKQPITVSHYNMVVFNRSHYNAWNLFGHIHFEDSTWNRSLKLQREDTSLQGKRLNINIELNEFKPWSFQEVKTFMDSRGDNWDFIDNGLKTKVEANV